MTRKKVAKTKKCTRGVGMTERSEGTESLVNADRICTRNSKRGLWNDTRRASQKTRKEKTHVLFVERCYASLFLI
jgi:hypothetical protein